jgi:membrane protein
MLLLGATGLFGQLQDALNTIWEVQPKPDRGIMGIIKDRFLSFTMILGVSFLLLVSLVISAALTFVNNYFSELLGGFTIVAQILNIVISIGVITLIFAMIFKILPDVEIAWNDVWIGALVTAVLFTIGRTLIGIYLGSTATTSAYGAAGSLIVILLWVFYSSQILFIGAEFTQVYARLQGSRIRPAENARALTETERAQQGAPRRQPQLENVQQSMMPITGQPEIHPAQEAEPARERVRYEPPNPNTVVPVIAGGALASIYTVGRVIRKLTSPRSRREEQNRFRRTILRIRR